MSWRQCYIGQNRSIAAVIENGIGSGNERPLIVTFAGFGQAMSEKNYLFSNLRKVAARHACRTVQFDYRGSGDSQGELGDATIKSMLNDAIDVLRTVTDEEAASSIYLIGHALGAAVAHMAALQWEGTTGTPCHTVAISPPPPRLPLSSSVFASATLDKLRKEGKLDAQLLVPGFDYYTLSDFNMDQHAYFTALGAHMLYLHGQCVSAELLAELDALDVVELFSATCRPIDILCGQLNEPVRQMSAQLHSARLHVLEGVLHYYEHPAAMDELIACIIRIAQRGENDD